MNGDETPELHFGDHANVSEKAIVDPVGFRDNDVRTAPDFDVHRTVLFSEIAGGTPEVIVEHEGQRYRLRATRNGRLLLNK